MTTRETNPEITITSIHPDTDMGLVALAVADLNTSVDFYHDVLGFKVMQQHGKFAVLGAGDDPLLLLEERTGAQPAPQNATGLYHFAILVPSRADLARSLLHLAESRYPLGGASDHLVSEALYLSDPDGNGIEIYRDRPREGWQSSNGQLNMGTLPLDLYALIGEAQAENRPWTGLAPGTKLGHMHLQVGNIPQARAFYNGILGFDVVVDMERMGALFISAGGYHHHIGLNTWHSRGGKPAPGGRAGLRYFTVRLPSAAARQEVLARLDAAGIPYQQTNGGYALADPWQNQILLTVGTDLPQEIA